MCRAASSSQAPPLGRMRRAASDATRVKVDDSTSVPADLFEEFRKAGKERRAGGQHRLAKNSQGVMYLTHANVVEKPKTCIAQEVASKVDGSSTETAHSLSDAVPDTPSQPSTSSKARSLSDAVADTPSQSSTSPKLTCSSVMGRIRSASAPELLSSVAKMFRLESMGGRVSEPAIVSV